MDPQALTSGRPSGVTQWLVLTRRNAETLVGNTITLAMLIGSPVAVIAMFALLFRPGSFDAAGGDPGAAVMITYWLAFASFFFGLTFGLLQVCLEIPVLRREYHAGVRTTAYVCSKLALLTPLLLMVNAAMIVVLRVFDRLPELSGGVTVALFCSMALNGLAALCLGLLVSAVVATPAQAALALPVRWAFESIAGHLGVGASLEATSPHSSLGSSPTVVYWAVLGASALILGTGAHIAVHRRAAGPAR